MHDEHQVPIWFFIGALLLIYGVLICGAGIYAWVHPPENPVKLFQYHADVWWGALMTIVGLGYSIRFNPLKPGETLTGDAER